MGTAVSGALLVSSQDCSDCRIRRVFHCCSHWKVSFLFGDIPVPNAMSTDKAFYTLPIGSLVVLGSEKVIPKRNYQGASGYEP